MINKVIQVVVIKDPKGNIWSTPKGKSSWGSVGAAKNAWGCHNWKRHPKYPRINTNKIWKEDAEGWTTEVIQEYEVVPR